MNDPIPLDQRSSLVKPFLERKLEMLIRLRASELAPKLSYPIYLSSILYPWLFETSNQSYDSSTERSLFETFQIDGKTFLSELDEILGDDSHLRKCCGNSYLLGRCFDLFFSQLLADADSVMPTKDEFAAYFDRFSDMLYAETYKVQAFSHLFNFHSEHPNLEFGDFRLIRLSNMEIARLLGEQTTFSFLHPFGGGEFFLLSETSDQISNDVDWVFNKLYEAEDFARGLQYFKDGVIHVNYTSHYFRPDWVNTVRKNQIFVIGPQRKLAYEEGTRPYTLNDDEYNELLLRFAYLNKPEIAELFGENRNKLGKAIEFGGTYFESSHTQTENIRRLIDLSIALEAIFHPHNYGEITFQLSQLAAAFIGRSIEEKHQIFADIKKMYGKRSDLFHGKNEAQEEGFVTTEEIENWTSLIRRALVGFIVLYLRGEQSHKAIIEQIRTGLLDPKVRRALRQRSDVDRFKREIVKQI